MYKLIRHDKVTLLESDDSVCLSFKGIQKAAEDIQQNYAVAGYIYNNQFLIVELLEYEELSLSNAERVMTLEMLSEQGNWNTTDGRICLLEAKVLCSKCNAFPCTCTHKLRRDKKSPVPIDVLTKNHKLALARNATNVNTDIAIELYEDDDEEVRRTVYRNTDRDVIISAIVEKAVDALATKTWGKEDVEEYLDIIYNVHLNAFLLQKVLTAIIGFDEKSRREFREYVLYIIQNPNVSPYVLETVYRIFGNSLTTAEQVAMLNSNILPKDIRDKLLKKLVGKSPETTKALEDHLRCLEKERQESLGLLENLGLNLESLENNPSTAVYNKQYIKKSIKNNIIRNKKNL